MSASQHIVDEVLRHIEHCAAHHTAADTYEALAERLRRSRANVYEAIGHLKSAGIIAVEGDSHTSRYVIIATAAVTAWRTTRHARGPARGAGPGRQRPCLCCARPFASDGPHHRLCSHCRTRSADAGGIAGARRNGEPMFTL